MTERELGEELLEAVGAGFPPGAGVSQGRMFNGQGLKVGGKFFAFISHTGRLVVKLPPREVRRLIDDRAAEPVTMGKRTMREWVSLPRPADGEPTAWRDIAEMARAFVATAA
jgi:hypothetical protein